MKTSEYVIMRVTIELSNVVVFNSYTYLSSSLNKRLFLCASGGEEQKDASHWKEPPS